jgi:hypothetical protein
VSRRFSLGPVLVATVIALALLVGAATAWRSQPHADQPQLSLASKRLRLTQTHANKALIKMSNAKPGQVANGKTRVRIKGSRAKVRVGIKKPRDIPGPNGGKLIASRHLWIKVRCTKSPCPRHPVAYKGPLASMGKRGLGTWRAGTHRTYAVRVWLRRGGTPSTPTSGDNRYQHSIAKFGLLWTATAR